MGVQSACYGSDAFVEDKVFKIKGLKSAICWILNGLVTLMWYGGGKLTVPPM